MRIAGLISGTSVDGIDVAIADIDDQRMHLIAHGSVAYPPGVRTVVLSVSNRVCHTGDISRLNFLLGELFAEAVIKVCTEQNVALDSIELIGSHGQTIFHEGDAGPYGGREIVSTLQIGEPAVIAERLGKPVIANFRVADMAAGGKGAPLVPFFDYRVFRHPEIHRVSLNIGGISNITVIPANAKAQEVVAFDTGPGNMIMDALAPPYDEDGRKARAGKVNQKLLDGLLYDSYYHREPPKTAGREQYGADFIARTGIDLTTAAELTASTIAMSVARYPKTQEVIVSGGGAHNSYLCERLQTHLGAARLLKADELGVNVDAKEALLFALLAWEWWNGHAAGMPSVTGARFPARLGTCSYPSTR